MSCPRHRNAALVPRRTPRTSGDQRALRLGVRGPIVHGACVRGMADVGAERGSRYQKLEEKLALVNEYRSQTATVDYAGFVEGIAKTRAFYSPVRTNRGGAAEAYLALPNGDYCDLVTSVYGADGKLSTDAKRLLA